MESEINKSLDISVVMPVYNSGKYLEQALYSLMGQTLGNMEIICVNDASTDDSAEILDRLSKKDSRIKVITQSHMGAGAARNTGLSAALGEYVIFLDSDDFFDSTLLEKTVGKGKKTQADAVLFGAKRYDDRTGETVDAPRYLWGKLIPEKEVFSRKDMKGELFGLTTPPTWTKIFRRDFIIEQEICFQELPNSNDVRFVLTALAAGERIAVVLEDLVYYRVFREGSLQNKKDEAPLCFLDAYRAAYDELNRRGIYEDVEKGFCNMVLSGCVYNLNTLYSEKARWTAIRALCSEKFTGMGILEHPLEYYDMPRYRHQIAGLPCAVRIKDESRASKEPGTCKRCDSGAECAKKAGAAETAAVSVIVAVCNMQNYLTDCLDSILGQTFKDLEIICIDDGSSDESLSLLLAYARKDCRIKVYHQSNRGLSAVRNSGLSLASGEYIYFIDSDDMLVPEGLEELYRHSLENKLDILYFNGDAYYEDQELKKNYPQFQDYYIRKGMYPAQCTGLEMFMKMRNTGEYRTNVGIQFFRREFLCEKGLGFCEGILHEDNDFSFAAMLTAERAGYTDGIYFRRRIREGSIMTAKVSFSHCYGYFRGFLNMLGFLERRDLPEEIMEMVSGMLKGMLDNAKSRYNELTEEEKYARLGLEGKEYVLFRLFVSEEAAAYAGMKQAYREKSEINRKLQITYKEKYDRGLEIKRLKKELEAIRMSETYRLAGMIGFPVRIFRKIIKKIQKH